MKYQYEIFKNDSTIQELFYNSKNEICRTKQWIIKNFPELMI
jgi:hypothetical protein